MKRCVIFIFILESSTLGRESDVKLPSTSLWQLQISLVVFLNKFIIRLTAKKSDKHPSPPSLASHASRSTLAVSEREEKKVLPFTLARFIAIIFNSLINLALKGIFCVFDSLGWIPSFCARRRRQVTTFMRDEWSWHYFIFLTSFKGFQLPIRAILNLFPQKCLHAARAIRSLQLKNVN